MMDKLDKIFEENPELKEKSYEFLYELMPFIIESLLLSNKIDRTRTNDPKYVLSIIVQNLDVVDSLRHGARIDHQIMEAAKEATEMGRIPVVVIVVETSLEHIINLFYREVLEKRFHLSSDEATEAIRSNFQTKLGWLMQIVGESKLSDELSKRIKQITDLRNAYAHYKAIGVSLNEKDKSVALINQAKSIGLDVILNTPDELEEELYSKYADLFPERELASKLSERVIEFMSRDES